MIAKGIRDFFIFLFFIGFSNYLVILDLQCLYNRKICGRWALLWPLKGLVEAEKFVRAISLYFFRMKLLALSIYIHPWNTSDLSLPVLNLVVIIENWIADFRVTAGTPFYSWIYTLQSRDLDTKKTFDTSGANDQLINLINHLSKK